MTGYPFACRLALAPVLALVLIHLGTPVLATSVNPPSSASPKPAAGLSLTLPSLSPQARLRSEIQRFLFDQSQDLPGDVNVQVQLADTVDLPECPDFSLSSPPNARPMGRSNIIVRCPGTAGTWSLVVPVQVEVIASYLVTARHIPARQVLSADDLVTRRGDLGSLPSGVLTQPEQAIGQVPRLALSAGQPLRKEMLKVIEVIRAGQSVKVVSIGSGFEVSNTGVALNGGGVGATVRVRLGNGQVVSGTATSDGAVRLGS